MLFQRKIDRAQAWLEERNRPMDDRTLEHHKGAFDQRATIKLEKGELPAVILSALLVFLPVFLVLLGIAFLAYVLVM